MTTTTKFVGTGANLARAGSTDSISNPGNCTADDGTFTGLTGDLDANSYTDYLHGTMAGNLFAIAADQQIDGIEIEIEMQLNGSATTRVDSVILTTSLGDGDEKSDSYFLTTSPVARTYGGASDKHGLALTPAVINAGSLGVKISWLETAGANGKRPEVDYIKITIHHSDAPASGGQAIMIM